MSAWEANVGPFITVITDGLLYVSPADSVIILVYGKVITKRYP